VQAQINVQSGPGLTHRPMNILTPTWPWSWVNGLLRSPPIVRAEIIAQQCHLHWPVSGRPMASKPLRAVQRCGSINRRRANLLPTAVCRPRNPNENCWAILVIEVDHLPPGRPISSGRAGLTMLSALIPQPACRAGCSWCCSNAHVLTKALVRLIDDLLKH